MEHKNSLPRVAWISREELTKKIENNETFVVYHSLQNCPDCGRLDQTFLQYYLAKKTGSQSLFRVEVHPWRQFKNHEDPLLAQKWEAYIDAFQLGFHYQDKKMKTPPDPTYVSARIPALQAWQKGQLKEMVVYYNDRFSPGDWPKTILGSFFKDGPIDQEFADYYAYVSSSSILAFYNHKIALFLDKYLV